ncbi:MAG: GNAT family N-acetyltransferase [Actinobacteria bacterium]|nr:GNAT family N-acetyltransferase [Actinomycetota bacterium]
MSLREPEESDIEELQGLIRASKDLHHPWVDLDDSREGLDRYLAASRSDRAASFLVCEGPSGQIIGVVNLSEIVRGVFQSAYLSFYAHQLFAGRGLMHEGLQLVVMESFGSLGLHRLEANIQPGNERSKRLVERCGFRLEGFSPRYLRIGDEWRDHERWALTVEDHSPLGSS